MIAKLERHKVMHTKAKTKHWTPTNNVTIVLCQYASPWSFRVTVAYGLQDLAARTMLSSLKVYILICIFKIGDDMSIS